jgi:hypothetical protein
MRQVPSTAGGEAGHHLALSALLRVSPAEEGPRLYLFDLHPVSGPHTTWEGVASCLRAGAPRKAWRILRKHLCLRRDAGRYVRLADLYSTFRIAFLRRCDGQVLGPCRHLAKFADSLWRRSDVCFHLEDPAGPRSRTGAAGRQVFLRGWCGHAACGSRQHTAAFPSTAPCRAD